MTAAGRTGAGRPALLALGAVAVLVQVVVLYLPVAPGEPPFQGADKVVHLLVFAVPVLLLLLAGAPVRPVVAVFAAHAGVSEVVQGALLPDRSGDWTDAVADLVGVAVGWAGWRLARYGAPVSRW